MEASLQRHNGSLAQCPALAPFLDDGRWGCKFQVSNHGLVSLVTSPHLGAHQELSYQKTYHPRNSQRFGNSVSVNISKPKPKSVNASWLRNQNTRTTNHKQPTGLSQSKQLLSLGFSTYSIMSSAYNDSFTSFSPVWTPFISFSWLWLGPPMQHYVEQKWWQRFAQCFALPRRNTHFLYSYPNTTLTTLLTRDV